MSTRSVSRPPGTRENHPPISNPARNNNVALGKHGIRRDPRAAIPF
jgi:hypothetical protein